MHCRTQVAAAQETVMSSVIRCLTAWGGYDWLCLLVQAKGRTNRQAVRLSFASSLLRPFPCSAFDALRHARISRLLVFCHVAFETLPLRTHGPLSAFIFVLSSPTITKPEWTARIAFYRSARTQGSLASRPHLRGGLIQRRPPPSPTRRTTIESPEKWPLYS